MEAANSDDQYLSRYSGGKEPALVMGAVGLRHLGNFARIGFLTFAVLAIAGCDRAASASPPGAQRQATTSPRPAVTSAGSPSPSHASAAGAQPGVPASSLAAAGEKRLAVIQDGDWIFVKNGATVRLENGLSVELFLSPYPPTKLRAVLDLYVARGGEPVTDAIAEITYDMKGMSHGPFVSVADNRGDGHYLVSLDYGMFSAWEHKLVLDLGKDRYELGAGMMVFPGPL
ncbi:MAG: FixH family protein [Dehalococcoidia bacterium]|nr:FixH family protein [Dehalococcoidia bacterium]